MSKRSEQNLTKEDRQIEKQHMKRYSTSFVIRELKIKTTRDTTTRVKMAKTEATGNAGEDVERP